MYSDSVIGLPVPCLFSCPRRRAAILSGPATNLEFTCQHKNFDIREIMQYTHPFRTKTILAGCVSASYCWSHNSMPPGSVLTGRPVSGPVGCLLAQPIMSNGVGSLTFDRALNAPQAPA